MAKVNKVGEVCMCALCGNVAELRDSGGGKLVCCGQPTVLVG